VVLTAPLRRYWRFRFSPAGETVPRAPRPQRRFPASPPAGHKRPDALAGGVAGRRRSPGGNPASPTGSGACGQRQRSKRVPGAGPHAARQLLWPAVGQVLAEERIPAELRSHVYTKERILMPEASRNTLAPEATPGSDGTVVYQRPSSDEIRLAVSAGGPGFVNVLETYDPGWSGQVDGHPVPLFAANGFTLAAPVAAGQHAVRFVYRTPGRALGIGLSLLATGLLAGLIGFTKNTVPVASPTAAPATIPPSARTRRRRR
jgi:hypothetical protein